MNMSHVFSMGRDISLQQMINDGGKLTVNINNIHLVDQMKSRLTMGGKEQRAAQTDRDSGKLRCNADSQPHSFTVIIFLQ